MLPYDSADAVLYMVGIVEYRGTVCTLLNRGAANMDAGPGPPVVLVGICGVFSDHARLCNPPSITDAAGYAMYHLLLRM